MTEIHEVELSTIDLGERSREEYGDLDSLATSMRLYGLISPIIIRMEDMRLIIGGRRLEAAKLLGWETIQVIYKEDCDDVLLKEIELEENLQRLKLTWQEEVRAKRDLHELKQKQFGETVRFHEGGWRLEDTAKGLGVSMGSLSMDIQLAKGMDTYPGLAEEKDKTTAYRVLKKLEGNKKWAALPLTRLEEAVKLGDGLEWMREMEAGTVDLILTEPPGDIDWGGFLTLSYRVLKSGGSLLLFQALDEFINIRQTAIKVGFGIDLRPYVWVHEPIQTMLREHPSSIGNDLVFYLYKGKQRDNSGRANSDWFMTKRVDIENKYHPDQKPIFLLGLLIVQLTDPGELVIDPFAGSGSTVIAAAKNKRVGMGCEIREEYVQSANEAYTRALHELDTPKGEAGVSHSKDKKPKKLDPERDFFQV